MLHPRNLPCPCGSGRKHKHCCLTKATQAPESIWTRIERAQAAVEASMVSLIEFFRSHYGDEGLDLGWQAFWTWPEDPDEFDPGAPHQQAFLSWLLFDWEHQVETEGQLAANEPPPAAVFLARRGWQIGPAARSWLDACLRNPFSLYEVVSTSDSGSLRLRDMLVGQEAEVLDRSNAGSLQPGQVVFARLVPFEQAFLFEAVGDVVLMPKDKLQIIDLRQRMRMRGDALTTDSLRDWGIEIRDFYLDLAEAYLNPRAPALQNTDGDPFEWHRLRFAIDDAVEAFGALRHLDTTDRGDAGWANARREDGSIGPIEWHWSRPDDPDDPDCSHTYLARFCADNDVLTVEANSANRSETVKGLVRAALSQRARLLADDIVESPEPDPAARSAQAHAEQQALLANPEMRATMIDFLDQHYRRWEDTPLPALDGRSPRGCLASPAGRERVAALVDGVVLRTTSPDPGIDREVARRLRERLGLG